MNKVINKKNIQICAWCKEHSTKGRKEREKEAEALEKGYGINHWMCELCLKDN